jgi:hypothetical protein
MKKSIFALVAGTMVAFAAPVSAELSIFEAELKDGNNAGNIFDESRPRDGDNEGVGVEQLQAVVVKTATGHSLVMCGQSSYQTLPIGPPPGDPTLQLLCATMPFTAAGPDTTQVTFAFKTANDGNDDRNSHNMKMSTFVGHDGTEKILLKYGYQPNNRTNNYVQVIDSSLQTLMPQTLQYEQNNDNCNANIDNYKLIESTATAARFFGGVECNGNGNDDGGASLFRITFANGNYQLANDVDYL